MYEFKSLATLAKGIRFIQEALAIISGFLIMLGLVFSMTNLLTDNLLNGIPGAQVGWAITQSVAVDANLLLTFARAASAWRARRWGEFMALIAIGLILLAVAVTVTDLESLQQALKINLPQAAELIHLNIGIIVNVRSLVIGLLAAIIGWNYFAIPGTSSQDREPLVINMATMPVPERPEPPGTAEMEVIRQEQLTRLENAYETLQAEGRLTANSLQRLSQVRREVVLEFLNFKKATEEAEQREELPA